MKVFAVETIMLMDDVFIGVFSDKAGAVERAKHIYRGHILPSVRQSSFCAVHVSECEIDSGDDPRLVYEINDMGNVTDYDTSATEQIVAGG